MASNFPDVAPFCVLFQRLRGFVEDDPQNLLDDSIRDQSIRDLCEKLAMEVFFLQQAEKKHPELFIMNVNESFIKLWRDYEKRFAEHVGWVSANVLLESLGLEGENIEDALQRQRPQKRSKLDEWHEFHSQAKRAVGGISTAIDFALDQVSQDWREFPDDFADEVEAGADCWKHVTALGGVDLVGFLRRRSLLPVVFLPRKIADQQSTSAKTALLANLHQAQRAFTLLGSDAALPMLRATMERVVRDHLRAVGKDLEQQINSLKSRAALPSGCLSESLHRLRLDANNILHGSKPRNLESSAGEELAVVAYFVQVRMLVESVK